MDTGGVAARVRRTVQASVILVALCACGAPADEGGGSRTDRPAPTATSLVSVPATAFAPPTTEARPEHPAVELVRQACAGGLAVARGGRLGKGTLAGLAGVAVAQAGPDWFRAWAVTDAPQDTTLYGLGSDGVVRLVEVDGAEAVDWEDLARVDGPEPHLWIADTGDNNATRATVQLYRVPLPDPTQERVTAERVDVTLPAGPVNIEAILADAAGTIHLITQEPRRARIYRVQVPPGGGAAPAVDAGEFRPGEGPETTVTSADLAPDGTAVVIRTYGAAWLYPIDPGQDVAAALVAGQDPVPGQGDRQRRCKAPAGREQQGEAVGFFPDGGGYLTIGEGEDPAASLITPRPD